MRHLPVAPMFCSHVCCLAAFALFAAAGRAEAQTTFTLSPVQDNTLYSENASASNGAGEHLFVGRTASGGTRRALLAFDLSPLPAGATVVSVSLTVNVTRTVAGPQPLSLHRAAAAWGEGASDAGGQEGGGAPGAAGDATWSHARLPDVAWSQAGGDFAAAPSASVSLAGEGPYTVSSDGMVADVQGWLGAPAQNFGWILRGNEGASRTAKRLGSRENGANAPVLRVTVTTPTPMAPGEGVAQFSLALPAPHPVRAAAVVLYTLPSGAPATLDVFNLLGQRVGTLADGWHQAGTHRARFAGAHLPPGVYVLRLQQAGRSVSRVLARVE